MRRPWGRDTLGCGPSRLWLEGDEESWGGQRPGNVGVRWGHGVISPRASQVLVGFDFIPSGDTESLTVLSGNF